MMAQIPALLALIALISAIVTMVIGVSVGHENASVETLIYAGMATIFLQVFALAVTFIHSRLVTQDIAELMLAVKAAEEGASPASDGIRQPIDSHASKSR
ncbi:MAG: hypothetical protein P8K76_13180 [Candidatus Binatia bacterium]|nr:hypothetical protein [Candidatus Binatia bacterium]MDG1957573.1 hypothetical protein [Candidatus Binatia bacterium]MDG2010720.1 hypothetical protein [Candidatus Binatia bacterium]HAC79866.1 hypothetical protein [Deltaproteobacteria bacterium]